MKLMHLADLHIGKRVNDFQMIEDQAYILNQIIQIGMNQKVDGVLIAGDIYDKSQPSVDAIELFDDFLNQLKELNIPVFIISGNHDSPERIQYASRFLTKSNIFITGVFKGTMDYVEWEDQFGPVRIYLLPYVKPGLVKHYLDEDIETYDDAIRQVINHTTVDWKVRNVLMGHQFVMGQGIAPQQSDSENVSVGGLDQVYAEHFKNFDYVALGHLHAPQKIGFPHIWYAGSPLKYSASEVNQKKNVLIVQLLEKGNVTIDCIPLLPKRDMISQKGTLDQVIEAASNTPGWKDRISEDYVHVILTDEEVYDPIGKLRVVYPNLMSITFSNHQKMELSPERKILEEDIQKKDMMELFQEFYVLQNQKELSKEQIRIVKGVIERMEKEEL